MDDKINKSEKFIVRPKELILRHIVPIAIVGLGIASLLIMIFVDYLKEKQGHIYSYNSLLMSIDISTANSHLWFEEYVAGDTTIDIEKSLTDIDQSVEQIGDLLKDGLSWKGVWLQPVDDKGLIVQVKVIKSLLMEFKSVAVERLAKPEMGGIGSVLDQRFDEIYERLAQELGGVHSVFDAQSVGIRKQSQVFFWAILLIWVAIISWSVVNIIKLETIRRRGEEAIQASLEHRFTNILETSGEAIISFDEKQHIIVFNQGAEKIFGYRADEAIGKPLDILLPPDIGANHKAHFEEFAASDDSMRLMSIRSPVSGLRKDGTIFPAEVSLSKVSIDGETIFNVILIDITERKSLMEEKLDLQEKLVQAQRMESLGLLAGGVAHDLNNIIGPIMAYPDLIKMNLSEGVSVDSELDAISSSAQRAADVISDLLALTRRGKYKMEPINLNYLVKDYLDSVEYKSIRELHPEVITDIQLSKDRLLFNGSKAHLPKVIMNLVNNACESMQGGGILSFTTSSINIEDENLRDKNMPQGRYNLLTIEDQGDGIAEKDISKIFDPFYTTKMKSGKSGTGLGLSVVYNVLKDHGAYIDVKSKLDEGTKLSIYFPEIAGEIKGAAKVEIIGQRSGNVLVVDDREEQRKIASLLLSKLGYKVESVESGQKAINYLKKNDYDLVWLDMILEDDMDGLDTYKEIVKIKPRQKTIIVSGYSESDRVKEAERLGVNGFLQKPYKLKDIDQIIRMVIGGSKN